MAESAKDIILRLFEEKASLKQDVFHKTIATFKELKSVVKEVVDEFKPLAHKIDPRITVEYKDRSEVEMELHVAGDVLIFYMHTNVFEFDRSHPIWKTSYVREDIARSYCGMINVYNFLADSFRYNRINDLGYLIARVFLNHEAHYFVEGKRQLGFLYNDFPQSQLDRAALRKIVESAIVYALDFDLFTPPFDVMKEVTMSDIMEASFNTKIQTGKRLGFKFQADSDHFEAKND
ncbi:MAG: hypothetical protein ACRCYO_14440 [Bacteroidia bacterium]